MYLRKMRPRTTCLYSAASMLLRSLSAASQSLASKPILAEVSLLLEERVLAMSNRLFYPENWGKARRATACRKAKKLIRLRARLRRDKKADRAGNFGKIRLATRNGYPTKE